MKAPLGIAVIGCGQIAPRHVTAIEETEGLELRAVCDVDRTRRETWAARLGVPGLSNLETVLERQDVDLVAVCTPNHLHVPMARAALAAGKHVVVEKPVALSAADALGLDAAFRERGLSLFVVLQVRFTPAVVAVRETLASGGLGRLYLASLAQRWNRGPAYFAGKENWHGKRALEGGALFTQGVHYIDLLLELAGPVDAVSARVATQAHPIETEDTAVAQLSFRSGALGTLEFTLNAYEKNLEASLTLLGERGSVVLGGTAANEISLWDVASRTSPQGLAAAVPNDYGGAYSGSPPNHAAIYRNVARHLLEGTEPIAVTAASAAGSLAVIEAIYASATTGRVVSLHAQGGPS